MTFEEMLDHALAMLQRRGRLTYRTLQRQFHLDDDALNDLKDALLYAHPEVHDDEGRGLVWTGESSRASQRALAGLVRYYGDAGVLVLVRALLQREGRQGPGLAREHTDSWHGSRCHRHRRRCRLGVTSTGRGQYPNRARAGRANARA